MYGGYERGVLGWGQDEDETDEEKATILAHFEGVIHQWAGQFGLTAFVDISEDHVTVRIRESGLHILIHQSDILNGVTDARKTVVGISGRTDLT